MENPVENKMVTVLGIGGAGCRVLRGFVGSPAAASLRLLAVDGVTPSNETIADQSYPLCNEFYAAILQDSAADSPERRIYEWLSTDAGRSCIEHSGYVAVQ